MAHPFLDRLARGPILGDGAMGTMLHARGAALDQCLEELCLTRPDWVSDIHLGYVKSGAEIIQTNTFGGSRLRLVEYGLADKVREINFRGVKLAREAREISGQAAWIAGSVGPLGRRARSGGRLRQEEVAAAFAEQIGVLWEAGADLLILETFSDLDELAVAVEMARRQPICPWSPKSRLGTMASRPPAQDRPRWRTSWPRWAWTWRVSTARWDRRACWSSSPRCTGPSRPCAWRPCPTLGLLIAAGERMVYPSAPHYFAERVPQFLAAGTLLVGGCCGTTPAHIQAMRAALDDAAQRSAPDAGLTLQPIPMVRVSSPAFPETEEEAPALTGLLRKLRAGKFVVSVEVDPPRGFSAAKMLEGARIAQERGADAVNVADSPMARVRMSALALCVLIQQQVGIETILHYTTRDRSLMAIQSDLIGAHALEVRNIIALTGDPPSLGDQQDSTAVYDVDSIGLVKIIDQFNAGLDRAGKPFGGRSAFTVAVASDPTRVRSGSGGRPLPSQGLRRRASDDDAADLRPGGVAALLCSVRRAPRPVPGPRADRHPAAAEPSTRQLSA